MSLKIVVPDDFPAAFTASFLLLVPVDLATCFPVMGSAYLMYRHFRP